MAYKNAKTLSELEKMVEDNSLLYIDKLVDEYRSRHLFIQTLTTEDLDAEAERCGLKGSPTRVYKVESVVDVACGTGFHSVVLAREGFQVTAADGSANMIARTEENAREHGVALAGSQVADWLELDKTFGADRFDALICLGNAFTHLFEHEARRTALEAMYKVVKPGGLVIIDHRNYDAMLDQGYSSKHKFYYTGHGVDARPVRLDRTMAKFEYKFPDGARFYLTMCSRMRASSMCSALATLSPPTSASLRISFSKSRSSRGICPG